MFNKTIKHVSTCIQYGIGMYVIDVKSVPFYMFITLIFSVVSAECLTINL